jgi:hypothetical protein
MAPGLGLLQLLVVAASAAARAPAIPPPPPIPDLVAYRRLPDPPPPLASVLDREVRREEDAPRRSGRPSDRPALLVRGEKEDASYPALGLVLGAGVPEGIGVSVMLRPWKALRLHGGVASNLMTIGLHGGLSLVPFDFPLAPVLMFEAGRFAEGDLSRLAERLELPNDLRDYGKLGYDFTTATVGLELGVPRRFVVFARVGASWVRGHLTPREVDLGNDSTRATLKPGVVELRALMPAARIGLQFFLG